MLDRYAIERLLYRLSTSEMRTQFWLKGALLFDLWFDEPLRPTRDADLLGFGDHDGDSLASSFRRICEVVADDGIVFNPESVKVRAIRESSHYHGYRVTLTASLTKARCSVRVDIGFGDAVTPGPEEVRLPTLLPEMPRPELRAYPRATVVAEKLEAIVDLGMSNSRMKDYFDLLAIVRENVVNVDDVALAIEATFARRRTSIPEDVPIGLTDEFAADASKRQQWNAFVTKNKLDAPSLAEVVSEVREFVGVLLCRARERSER